MKDRPRIFLDLTKMPGRRRLLIDADDVRAIEDLARSQNGGQCKVTTASAGTFEVDQEMSVVIERLRNAAREADKAR